MAPLAIFVLMGIAYTYSAKSLSSTSEKRRTRTRKELADDLPIEDPKVDEAFSDLEKLNLRLAFQYIDTDFSKVITSDELKAAASSIDLNRDSNSPAANLDAQLRSFFMEIAQDGQNRIDFGAFAQAMYRARIEGQGGHFAHLVDEVEARVTKVPGAAIVYAALLLTFLVLISTSTMIFQYFSCEDFPEGPKGDESFLSKVGERICNASNFHIAILHVLIFCRDLAIISAGLLDRLHQPTLRAV